ncbi:MAG: hypothetical protein JSV49_00120 [Thermoplasmata archaeon]|nr:MAG: hypothetical protein JSV49_00120 [Thermoplasmata archaeon]
MDAQQTNRGGPGGGEIIIGRDRERVERRAGYNVDWYGGSDEPRVQDRRGYQYGGAPPSRPRGPYYPPPDEYDYDQDLQYDDYYDEGGEDYYDYEDGFAESREPSYDVDWEVGQPPPGREPPYPPRGTGRGRLEEYRRGPHAPPPPRRRDYDYDHDREYPEWPAQRYPYRRQPPVYDQYQYPVQTFWDQMGFYNLIWDPRYNVKIPVMQIIAIFSLVIIFIMNYTINDDYVIQLGKFSPFVRGQPPEVAWIFALILSIFLSVFPRMDRELRVTISLGIIIIIILFFLGGPAIAFFATYDMMEVGAALARSLISFLKVLTVLLYWAPILVGVYGIINRERMYLFLAILFFLGIIITNDLYLLSISAEHTKTAERIPLFTIFAVSLFCFYEMSDSSITFYKLNDSTRTKGYYSPHQQHLNRILQWYFVFFIIFSALTLVLTWFILDFNEILKAMGSEQIATSIELNSIYGTIVSLAVMVIVLIFIGYLVRYDDKLRAVYYKFKNFSVRLWSTITRQEYDEDEYRGRRDEYGMPPPPSRAPAAFPYGDDKAHKIVITDEL